MKNKIKVIVIGVLCPALVLMVLLCWGALCEMLITGQVFKIIVFVIGALIAISTTKSLFNVLKNK